MIGKLSSQVLIEFKIGFDNADSLMIFGGLIGVLAAMAISALMLFLSRQLRGFLLYGILLAFSGGALFVSTALGSGVVPGDAGQTQIVFDIIRLTSFLICVVAGGIMLTKRSQWIVGLYLLQFVTEMYSLSVAEYVVPVWMSAFDAMFFIFVGCSAFVLLRPARRSIFDD